MNACVYTVYIHLIKDTINIRDIIIYYFCIILLKSGWINFLHCKFKRKILNYFLSSSDKVT